MAKYVYTCDRCGTVLTAYNMDTFEQLVEDHRHDKISFDWRPF